MQFRHWGHNVRFMLVLGTGPEAVAFARSVQDHSVLGLRVVGFLGDHPPAVSGSLADATYWGHMSSLPVVLTEQVVDEVAVCVPPDEWHLVEDLAQLAHDQGKIVRIPLGVPQMRTSERFLEDLDGMAVLSYANGPDEMTSHALKRFLDLAVAIPALILMAPFLLVVAVAMRLTRAPGSSTRRTAWACTAASSPSTSCARWSRTRTPATRSWQPRATRAVLPSRWWTTRASRPSGAGCAASAWTSCPRSGTSSGAR